MHGHPAFLPYTRRRHHAVKKTKPTFLSTGSAPLTVPFDGITALFCPIVQEYLEGSAESASEVRDLRAAVLGVSAVGALMQRTKGSIDPSNFTFISLSWVSRKQITRRNGWIGTALPPIACQVSSAIKHVVTRFNRCPRKCESFECSPCPFCLPAVKCFSQYQGVVTVSPVFIWTITDRARLRLVLFDPSQVNCAGIFVSADMKGGSWPPLLCSPMKCTRHRRAQPGQASRASPAKN